MFEKFTSVKEEQLLKLGQTFALVKRDSSLNIEIMGLYWNTVPKEQKLKFIVNKVWKKLC